jgi:hypothetical protein
MSDWRRHLFYRQECVKSTWKLRLGVIVVLIVATLATRGVWTEWLAQSLVCARDLTPSDLILIENFDPTYVLFERAAALEEAGLAPRAVVPVQAAPTPDGANGISRGIAEVMARGARLRAWDIVPILEVEPYSMNAALQIREYLIRERVTSVILVTSGFRSRRSLLIYRTVLSDRDVQVRCEPVFGRTNPQHWTQMSHGIEEIAQQFFKLQYYRFYVIPFVFRRADHGVAVMR